MKRKALSPVIATVILSATVLMVGGGIWSYSMSAASMMANDYTTDTKDMVHTIIERLNIENVEYYDATQKVHVWVYNYGSIEISVDTTVTINDIEYVVSDTNIASEGLEEIEVTIGLALGSNESVSVRVETERENADYEVYYTP